MDTSLGSLGLNPGGWGWSELVSIVSGLTSAEWRTCTVQRDSILALVHGNSPGSESIVLTASSLGAVKGRDMCEAAHKSRGRGRGGIWGWS